MPSEHEAKPDEYNLHKGSIFFSEGVDKDFDKLFDTIFQLVGEVGNTKEGQGVIDEYRLRECHMRASHTLLFHKITEFSVYKELAHLAFWISKLKPITFQLPLNVFHLLSAYKSKLDSAFGGGWSKAENEFGKVDDHYHQLLEFPINEYISLEMIFRLIEASQSELIKKLEGVHVDQAKIRQAIEANKIKKPYIENVIRDSLRNHNHSTRVFATLVETLLKSIPEYGIHAE